MTTLVHECGAEVVKMSRSTKQDMRSKLVNDYVSQSCSARGKITAGVICKIDSTQNYMLCIITYFWIVFGYGWYDLNQNRIRILFFKNRIGSDSKKHYPIISVVQVVLGSGLTICFGWISVTGKFACNNSTLYRKQTCWNHLKAEAVRTKIKGYSQSKLTISQLTWLKTAILGH